MQLVGIKPNPTTFISIILAYSQIGALEQGIDIHQRIMDRGCSSNVVVATTLLDMYAKCGSIDKVVQENLIHFKDTRTIKGLQE